MSRRTMALAIAFLAVVVAALGTHAAYAALIEVKVGNFYYDDSSAGDGKVEATVGDQLRFVVQDGGPGTPHTVDVDELDIHSGSLAAGTTYTTPPLARAGTYRLYCKPHDRRGHVATLLVYNTDGSLPAATTTTAAPAPTTTASPQPTTAPQTPTTTRPVVAPTTAVASPTTAPPAESSTTTAASLDPSDAAPSDAAPSETVPVGTGQATAEELADVPVQPGSLEAALGRPTASQGAWTRSVRMALAALAPMLLLAGFAISRARSHENADGPKSRIRTKPDLPGCGLKADRDA